MSFEVSTIPQSSLLALNIGEAFISNVRFFLLFIGNSLTMVIGDNDFLTSSRGQFFLLSGHEVCGW